MSDSQQRTENFFAQFTKKEYKKGDTILFAGQVPDGVIYLHKGNVCQYAISEHTGNRLNIHIYYPQTFFPMIWALADKTNPYYFDAMGPVTIYRAPKDKFVQFIKQDNEVLFQLTARMISGLNGLVSRLEAIAFTDVYGRVITILLYLAQYFGSPHDGGIIIEYFTQQEIADFVGAARETVSIALEKLERAELISYVGHNIFIPSVGKLTTEFKKKRPR